MFMTCYALTSITAWQNYDFGQILFMIEMPDTLNFGAEMNKSKVDTSLTI